MGAIYVHGDEPRREHEDASPLTCYSISQPSQLPTFWGENELCVCT